MRRTRNHLLACFLALVGALLVGTAVRANGCGIPYDGGTNSYSISLPTHFTLLASCDSTATFNLTADVDLTGITVATRTNFTGTFDGNGHTISNMSISGSGLFDVAAGGATFTDVHFQSSTVTGGSGSNGWAGALVRESAGPVTISNSSFQGSVLGGTGSNSWAGGFIGEARGNLTITDSYVKGSVVGGMGANAWVGGFVGNAIEFASGKSLTFSRNYMVGSIVGGTGISAWAGGFFGQFAFGGPGTRTIENSFVSASVTSGLGVGAVANGFVGDATSGEFSLNRSYFEGSLTGSSPNVPQPFLSSGTVSPSSVFCVVSCGTLGVGTPKASLSLLKSAVAADSWDFTNTWCYSYGHNDGYPVLKGLTFGPNAAWGDCVPTPAPAPIETTTTTSTTTSPTTTTVSCQVASVQVDKSGAVARLQPGESLVVRDGVAVKSGVSVSAAFLANTVRVRGQGVASGSSVDVWLVEGRHFLGTLTTDSAGVVSGRLKIPIDVVSGVHTLQMVERNCNTVGSVVSLGIKLTTSTSLPDTGNDINPLLWWTGLCALAVGVVLRRKRNA